MADKELDLTNEICPRPMIMVMSTIKTIEKGEVLCAKTKDPSIRQSIPKLCERAGFTLLEMQEEGDTIRFCIRK